MTNPFNLQDDGITVTEIHRNLPPSALYEHAIRYEKDASIAENGALVAYSGGKTGRSPKDKRLVKHPDSEADVWWGKVNLPIEPFTFAINRERARDYFNIRDRIYCFDGFAGWDYPIKIRVICSRPYHALFMHTMLIRPTKQQLAEYGKPEFVIYNAGAFPANSLTQGMGSKTSIDLSFEDHEMVILGSEYAGEMKKGVFTLVNYLAPKRGILSMHCSATADKQTGRSSLLFGLSGTGKTTLSADPKRYLIGDDEHCWSDEGIFNIEGGCYAKAINLTPENEPEIFEALRFGAVLENVVLDQDHLVDYTNISLTENTRGAYPIRIHPECEDSMRCGPCDGCDFSDLRRIWRAASGQFALTGPGDVSLHQRLHRESCRHRGGSNGTLGNLFRLFWWPVSGLASKQICRAAGRQDESTWHTGVVGEHWLEWRRLWHRQAYQAGEYPGDRRCHPPWGARDGENPARSGIRLRGGDRMPKRARRNADSA